MHSDDAERMAFYQLATRYLLGHASSAEQGRLSELLQQPEEKAMFEEMRRGWDAHPDNRTRGFDLTAITAQVTAVLEAEPVSSAPSPAWWRGALGRACVGLAASLAFVGVASWLWLRPAPVRSVAYTPPVWQHQYSKVSERLEFTLEDGTKITLNAGGTLSYPEHFDDRVRVVRLTGEAFFDVTHDSARPFVVDTPTLRIKVLGTRFNVRAFSDGTKTQVTLLKGQVEVLPTTTHAVAAPVTLTPGMQYDFVPTSGAGQVQAVTSATATAWLQDRFVWDREPAASAMRQVTRRFGFPIEFTDQRLGEETISGSFDATSVDEIFEVLQLTEVFRIRVIRTNGKIERVVLSPGPLAKPAS